MLKQAKVVSVTFNNDMDRAHDNRTCCNISDANQALALYPLGGSIHGWFTRTLRKSGLRQPPV